MSAQGIYRINELFEEAICNYTGAPYCVVVDNCSNAIFISLLWLGEKGMEITIPERTYPSVPCEIIFSGNKVRFEEVKGTTLKGAYRLKPTNIWDSALHFTADMYLRGQIQCLSFSGFRKNLKLGKGGAILTDDINAYMFLKRARFSGRGEVSYHEDNFFMLGKNCYMLPEIAAAGLREMGQFYNDDGSKKINPPLEIPYPNLSQHEIYTKSDINYLPY